MAQYLWYLWHMQALPSCQGLWTMECLLQHFKSFHISMAELLQHRLAAQACTPQCFILKGLDLALWVQAALTKDNQDKIASSSQG